ncbi:class I SAM-dependent methyltransferase [Actinophytocola sediminis]
MENSGAGTAVTALLDAFAKAPANRVDAAYHQLVEQLWQDGKTTEATLGAVPEVAARLSQVDDLRKGHLIILLGLLAEASDTATNQVEAAVRKELGLYLNLWRGAENGNRLDVALQYLLAHFPGDRERILDLARQRALSVPDMARLERALTPYDPEDTEPDLGRVFPYPTAWQMDDGERDQDSAWVQSLTPDQIENQWFMDTGTILGYNGARAYWAVRNGAPVPSVPDAVAPRNPNPPEADVEIFNQHAIAFSCPNCHSGLTFQAHLARCVSCAAAYPISRGMVDLTRTAGEADEHSDDLLFQQQKVTTIGNFVEAFARPNFKRLCGFTWDGPVNPDREAKLIAEFMRPTDGPVLDIAAGAGAWTTALADAVGHDRVIALDLMPAILTSMRHRLPRVPAVVSSATTLPFGDATLGGAMCWNGPHAFIDDTPEAIAEVGRCLRPGGSFVTYTFRNSDDPIYRYFVSSHRFPQHEHGLRLYDIDEFKGWLADAGLVIREELNIGLAVIITAEKVY